MSSVTGIVLSPPLDFRYVSFNRDARLDRAQYVVRLTANCLRQLCFVVLVSERRRYARLGQEWIPGVPCVRNLYFRVNTLASK